MMTTSPSSPSTGVSQARAELFSEPIRIGPSGWPEHTLYLPVARWCRRNLRQPDGPDAGAAWQFTDEQARFLAWWYAVDGDGRWLFRRGTLRRVKGWGKDPLGAVMALVEFAGPCRFGGWAGDGSPITVEHPSPWIQIFAVARHQTRTTFKLFEPLLTPHAKTMQGIEVHQTVAYGRGGRATIEAITAAPTSAEGPRVTFVLRNEIQNWLSSNDGHEMAEVIDGNLAKSRDGAARALSICNAHVPGRDSVGEREWDAYQAIAQGRTRSSDVLYDSLEAPPDTRLDDEGSLRRGLVLARGDSHWLDVDRHVREIWDPRTTPSEARRKYLNQIVAAEDAWCAPYAWDALADEGLSLQDDDQVALGFDGSKSDDHCALIATRITDGAWLTLGVWDPEEYGGEAPRELIDGTVRRAFERCDVVAFFADLAEWESYVDRWAEELGRGLCAKASPRHPIAWDMRIRSKEFTVEGAMRTYDEVVERAFRHDANPRVRQHVHNARQRVNAWGVTFGKEHRQSKRKVDALAAGTLSRMARRAYLALPASRQRRKKRTGKAVAW